MKFERIAFKAFLIACLPLMLGAPTLGNAQDAAAGKMSIVAPVPPGGPMDFAARLLANEFQKRSGRTAIVDNKPGAGALIGAEFVGRARPDGATLLVHNTSIVAYPIFVETKFDSDKDLAPVSTLMGTPYVLFASNAMPKTLPEIAAFSKANPGKINIAVILNTLQQLRTYKMLQAAGISATLIPYPGTVPVQRALLANEVQLYMASPFGMDAFAKDGRLRAIATMANERYWGLPEVPTAKSQGVDFETSEKYLVFAPAGTPSPVVSRLSQEIAEILKDPQVANQIKSIGNIAQSATPEQTARELREVSAEALTLAKQAGVKRGQ
jgi:tripartite-type tricarboxylate transporter receptor subunit TctC